MTERTDTKNELAMSGVLSIQDTVSASIDDVSWIGYDEDTSTRNHHRKRQQ